MLALASLRQRKPKRDSGPEGPATAQADATRLEERGEPEMRALRLLREERADFQPDRLQKERCCRRVVQHWPGTFRTKVFPDRLSPSVECVMELRAHATSICFPP
jgi:hypothetical protein